MLQDYQVIIVKNILSINQFNYDYELVMQILSVNKNPFYLN